MKEIKFLNLRAQNNSIRDEILAAFENVLDSGFYVSGENVEKFEQSFSRVHNSKYAIGCNSGTSAIEIILRSLDVGPGDEVIIPAMTFVATMEAVVAVGATPVLVDVDLTTWNLCLDSAKKAISVRTKAMIFVHLHGSTIGVNEVKNFCEENNILLIEDAAQAHLATNNGVSVGQFGIAAAFSFYPGKNLGALGEGGAILTNSIALKEKAELVRNWGARQKYRHEIRGSNFRMDELQAAILSVKLKRLADWTEKRRELAQIYDEFFEKYEIHGPFNPNGEHVFHIYAVRLDNRDKVSEYLKARGIQTGIHYPKSLDTLSAWEPYFKLGDNTTNAHNLADNLLSLPLNEFLVEDDILYVTDTLLEIL